MNPAACYSRTIEISIASIDSSIFQKYHSFILLKQITTHNLNTQTNHPQIIWRSYYELGWVELLPIENIVGNILEYILEKCSFVCMNVSMSFPLRFYPPSNSQNICIIHKPKYHFTNGTRLKSNHINSDSMYCLACVHLYFFIIICRKFHNSRKEFSHVYIYFLSE